MFGDSGIDQRFAECLERGQCPLLVKAHKAAVARDICRQDCRQSALYTSTRHQAPARC
jgi:hypothetical protein